MEGDPALVCPPTAKYKVLVTASNCIPLVAWFSSERGNPRTRSIFTHEVPFQESRETMPELVSKFVVPLGPPIRLSLDETYITGLVAVPLTNIPVTCRVVTEVFNVPVSS